MNSGCGSGSLTSHFVSSILFFVIQKNRGGGATTYLTKSWLARVGLCAFLCFLANPSLCADQLSDLENRVQALLLHSRELLKAGKTAASQVVIREALELQRTLGDMYRAQGTTAFEGGDLSAAQDAFQRALACDVTDSIALLHLGRIAFQERDYSQAISHLSRILMREPDRADARTLLKEVFDAHYRSAFPISLNYTFPCQAIAFSDGDSLRLEVAYALPKIGLSRAGNLGVVYIDQVLYLSDQTGQILLQHTEHPTRLPEAGQSDFLRNYLIATHILQIPRQTRDLHLAVTDRKISSQGTRQLSVSPPFQEIEFALSPLLLARDIQPRTPYPEDRDDLDIQPNPLRLYRLGEAISVYLEFYNLMFNEYGNTAFEISYEIAPPEAHEIDLSLFESLQNLSSVETLEVAELRYLIPYGHRDGIAVPKTVDETRATRITIPYTGSRIYDMTYLQIEIPHQIPGVYKLILTGRDLIGREEATQTALFRIVP